VKTAATTAIAIALTVILNRAAPGGGPDSVLIVVNSNSPVSKTIGEYYARRRSVPAKNVCAIRTAPAEEIQRTVYEAEIARPIAECLKARRLTEQILYLVTTMGVPLKIAGPGGPGGEQASVDSELTLLYGDLHGAEHPLAGMVPNPLFQKEDQAFTHPKFPVYLVTRLAGYEFADVKAMVDRSLEARNRGVVVIDLKSSSDDTGNDWLRSAAIRLPKGRVVFDESTTVVEGTRNVIGYASWGSNDPNRKRRATGFGWLPGAIVTEFVSTNARTFARPPETWSLGTWGNKLSWFDGSPQSLTADYIHEGVTGASGHVYEPYLSLTPRPDVLLPMYLGGRNLAESYYTAMRGLSWRNVVIGDPLCRLQ
jgi:uncharacterized protein (TIGR03790 family)